MRQFLSIVLLLGLFVITAGCATAKDWPERRGWVLEAGTNKPIAGAIVIARWQGTASIWPAEAQTRCYHVETATTDEKGEYVIPSWGETASQLFLGDKKVLTDAYKPGYTRSPEYFKQQSYRKNIELMEVFKGTREERLAYLERMTRSSGCDSAGESRRNLYPLYEALYYEAKVNAAKEEDLQWYRRVAAKIAVGVSDQLTHAENEKRIEQFLREHLK